MHRLFLSVFALVLTMTVDAAVASDTAPANGGGGSRSSSAAPASSGGCNGQSSFSESQIEGIASKVHGGKATCYMKLYKAETSSNASCYQTAVPNPPGIGLCTIEGNPLLRNRRGGDCQVPNQELSGDSESGVEQQMRCCAYLMKSAKGYFQPVNEGKVSNCENGTTGA